MHVYTVYIGFVPEKINSWNMHLIEGIHHNILAFNHISDGAKLLRLQAATGTLTFQSKIPKTKILSIKTPNFQIYTLILTH